jgi:hypothetical protein
MSQKELLKRSLPFVLPQFAGMADVPLAYVRKTVIAYAVEHYGYDSTNHVDRDSGRFAAVTGDEYWHRHDVKVKVEGNHKILDFPEEWNITEETDEYVMAELVEADLYIPPKKLQTSRATKTKREETPADEEQMKNRKKPRTTHPDKGVTKKAPKESGPDAVKPSLKIHFTPVHLGLESQVRGQSAILEEPKPIEAAPAVVCGRLVWYDNIGTKCTKNLTKGLPGINTFNGVKLDYDESARTFVVSVGAMPTTVQVQSTKLSSYDNVLIFDGQSLTIDKLRAKFERI